MSFEKENKNDIKIIRIDREKLDSTIAPELKTELLLLVDQGIKKILVDLTKISYADSSGLGALLFGLRQLRDVNGTLKLLGANTRIMNLIRIAKLEKILINVQNEEEALKSF